MRGAASITEKSKLSLTVFWVFVCAAVGVAMKAGEYLYQSEVNARALDDNARTIQSIDKSLIRMDKRQDRMDFRMQRMEEALDLKPLPAFTAAGE